MSLRKLKLVKYVVVFLHNDLYISAKLFSALE